MPKFKKNNQKSSFLDISSPGIVRQPELNGIPNENIIKEMKKKVEIDITKSKAESISETKKIDVIYKKYTDDLKSSKKTASTVINLLILSSFMILLILIAQRFTCIDLVSFFETVPNEVNLSKSLNIKGFLISLAILCVFKFIIFIVFILHYLVVRKFPEWSISLIGSPVNFSEYFSVILIISIVLAVLYLRIPFWICAEWKPLRLSDKFKGKRNFETDEDEEDDYFIKNYEEETDLKCLTLFNLFIPLDCIKFKDNAMALVFLIRVYFFILIIFVSMVILIAQSAFRDPYWKLMNPTNSMINYENWNDR